MKYFTIYRHLPVFIQNILCSWYGCRLQRQRYGGNYRAMYNDLEQSDKFSEKDILHYKEQKISFILKYAYEHIPFYKKKFDEFGIHPKDFKELNDLRKFPILTKEEVREHWQEMLSDDRGKDDLIPYHTSGSTGKPLHFYWTKQSLRHYWATVWRGRNRFGIRKGDLHLNFPGKLVVPLEQKKPPFWRYNRNLNQYMLNQQHLTEDKVSHIVSFINNQKFVFFVGYPSIIYTLALLVEKNNLKVTTAPKYIFTSAEKVYSNQRELIERIFKGSKIIEHYGFSEEAGAASQCECGCYHEDFEMGHLEIKETGMTKGTLLATGFQNLAMPFIRYEIGDTAIFSTDKCRCGRNSSVIRDIEGRVEDYIMTPEGGRITRLDYILKESNNIIECQIVQREVGSIILRIVRKDSYSIEDEQKILKIISQQFSPKLKVVFDYVARIERTKAGKFKYVVSELSKK